MVHAFGTVQRHLRKSLENWIDLLLHNVVKLIRMASHQEGAKTCLHGRMV